MLNKQAKLMYSIQTIQKCGKLHVELESIQSVYISTFSSALCACCFSNSTSWAFTAPTLTKGIDTDGGGIGRGGGIEGASQRDARLLFEASEGRGTAGVVMSEGAAAA